MGVIEGLRSIAISAAWSVDLAAGFIIVGSLVMSLLASPIDTPTEPDWRRRLVRGNCVAAALLIASSPVVLFTQAAAVEPRGEKFDPLAWVTPLVDTRFGAMWLLRHGAILLLAAVVPLGEGQRHRGGRVACLVGAIGLCAVGMGATAWAGHASSNHAPWAIAVAGTVHILGAGVWLGTLPWLTGVFFGPSLEEGVAHRSRALVAARRSSMVTVAAALGVVASGVWSARRLAGPVPNLVGTPYGQLLLVKLALLVPMLVLAWRRARRLSRLGGSLSLHGHHALRHLARLTVLEAALGFATLMVTVILVRTPPGAGESPGWPLSFRFAPGIMWSLPGVKTEVAVGAEIVLFGLLAFVGSYLAKRWRPLLLATAGILLIIGLLKALSPMTVDAYPTTYLRPSVPYTAASVARGRALFTTHCAACHGAMGRGDGPAAASLLQIPADLTSPHTNDHTAGDMFWWLTNGLGLVMPAFGDRLSVQDRWHLINFVRALSARDQARALTSTLEPSQPRVGAPVFSFSTSEGVGRLKDYRGRQPVLLVFFTLPSSLPRLHQLARVHEDLVAAGAGVVAVSMEGAKEFARLAPAVPWPFPVVTDDGAAIVATYSLFREDLAAAAGAPDARHAPAHMEFLIDRSGYLRGRWIPGNPRDGWGNVQVLLSELRTLRREGGMDPPSDFVR